MNRNSPVENRIENTIISSVKNIKLLGVYIGRGIDFDYHMNQICKKASKKYTLYLGYVNIWMKINEECFYLFIYFSLALQR